MFRFGAFLWPPRFCNDFFSLALFVIFFIPVVEQFLPLDFFLISPQRCSLPSMFLATLDSKLLVADIYISISTETFDIENIKYEKTFGNS